MPSQAKCKVQSTKCKVSAKYSVRSQRKVELFNLVAK
jgi:hypothetical protein